MAAIVKKNTAAYQVQRVTLTSPKPLKATLAALFEELNKDKAGLTLLKIMAESQSKEEIEQGIGELTEGKRDFLLFAASTHSRWMNKFNDGKLVESYVITMGNPLIAKTFVPYDMRAGMYVPLRILVQATAEGGTMVFYDLPSSHIIIDENSPEEMKTAVYVLDAKLERTLTKVLSSDYRL